MEDPKRIRDSLAPRAFERRLLESALGPGPTNEQCVALWAAVERRILPGCGGGESGAGTSNGTSVVGAVASGGKTLGAGLVQGAVLLGVASAAVAIVGLARWGTSSSAPPESAHRAAIAGLVSSAPPAEIASDPRQSREGLATEVAPTSAARSSPPVAAPRPARGSVVAMPAPTPMQGATPESRDPASPLHAESALLLRAHDALMERDCSRALDLLDQARQRFADGVLAQEREAFGVQGLACAGRNVEAAEHAAAFLRDYPTSPYAVAIRRFLR